MPAWRHYQKTRPYKKSNGNSSVEKYHTEMKSLLDEPIRRFDLKKERELKDRSIEIKNLWSWEEKKINRNSETCVGSYETVYSTCS